MWFTIDTWYCFNTERVESITCFSDYIQIGTVNGKYVNFYCDDSTNKYKNLLKDIYSNFKNNTSYNFNLNNTKVEYTTVDNIANRMKNVMLYTDSNSALNVRKVHVDNLSGTLREV